MEVKNQKRIDPYNLDAPPATITQDLKIWPEYYEAVRLERKTFEIRSIEDRDFFVGDHLNLKEWNPETKELTGRSLTVKVSYVFEGGSFGIPENVAVLGIKLLSPKGALSVSADLDAADETGGVVA